jgi:hypothetical protein
MCHRSERVASHLIGHCQASPIRSIMAVLGGRGSRSECEAVELRAPPERRRAELATQSALSL